MDSGFRRNDGIVYQSTHASVNRGMSAKVRVRSVERDSGEID